MAEAAETAVRALHRELGFAGSDELYRTARDELDLGMSAKDLRALAKRITSTESSSQVLSSKPPFEGKVAARVMDDRWAMDLIDYKHWPHTVSYTHLRAHETRHDLVCRLLL